MPVTVNHVLTATTPDVIKRREANRRSYYKHLEKRRAYYRELLSKRRKSNPDAYNAYQRKMQTAYRRKDGVPEKSFNTPEQSKEKAKAQYARWAKANPHMTAALAAKRRALKRSATPQWANNDLIKAIYEEASKRTASEGIAFEVDHYYPLNSDFVCGLHCEQNLRVITATENMKKGNKCL